MRRANEWTAERFRSYGLAASLEPFDFGVTWERGPLSLRLTAPFDRAVTGHSWAWTAGTDGKTRKGPVVLVDLSTRDSFAVYRDRVRGAWVLPKPSTPIWNPDAPPPSPEDSQRIAAIKDARAQALTADTSAAGRAGAPAVPIDLPYMLKAAGALGTLVDGAKEHALMTMSGSPNRVAPLPNIVISHEDYTLLERLIAARGDAAARGRVENKLGKTPVQQWNTVGEIRGSRAAGPGRDPRCSPRQLGSRHRGDRQRRGIDGGAGGGPGHRAVRAQAQADHPLHPVQRGGAGAAGLAAYAGGARRRGGQRPGGAGARQRDRDDRRPGAAGTDGSGGALAGAARPVARLGADSVRERRQDGHRPPVVRALRGSRDSTSTSSRGGTSTPTTRRATPTTRRWRAI